MNTCIWNIKPEERQCQWCVVLFCQDRQPRQPKTTTTTQGLLEAEWSDVSIMVNGIRLLKPMSQTELATMLPAMYYTGIFNANQIK